MRRDPATHIVHLWKIEFPALLAVHVCIGKDDCRLSAQLSVGARLRGPRDQRFDGCRSVKDILSTPGFSQRRTGHRSDPVTMLTTLVGPLDDYCQDEAPSTRCSAGFKRSCTWQAPAQPRPPTSREVRGDRFQRRRRLMASSGTNIDGARSAISHQPAQNEGLHRSRTSTHLTSIGSRCRGRSSENLFRSMSRHAPKHPAIARRHGDPGASFNARRPQTARSGCPVHCPPEFSDKTSSED